MPAYGHDVALAGIQKAEGYNDTDSWNWSQPSTHHPSYPTMFDPSMYPNFAPQLQPSSRGPPRHPAATSHNISTGTNTPPPSRPPVAGGMVKAQPAFKPTWRGYLDTTKDAMTVVEAALQGRLSHISRRPHDKERAEMLTSGTVLVYEENASGIKRWTDAVHWSPSRVMNNCLIYRQLVRALKPEEKKSALNPSCGTKRKRKESAGLATTKTGENLNNSDDEYENPSFDEPLPADVDAMNKVYSNFAQSLTPDQQRRFCGSLIDSYEFKVAGLMKKTISVKYQGTHHHVISYYSLEDVVSGKLKRPFQDSKLADIQARPELLNGWKVSLDDEESKDLPLIAGYPHLIQPNHLQHQVIGAGTQAVGVPAGIQTHAPLHLPVQDYWHGPHLSQYQPSHHSPQHYTTPQAAVPQYQAHQPAQHYPPQQAHPTYAPQPPPAQHYVASPSPQDYHSPESPSPQFPVEAAPPQPYAPRSHPARHYSLDQQHAASSPPYPQQAAPAQAQYAVPPHPQVSQPPSYTLPQTITFDVHAPVQQSLSSGQEPSHSSVLNHDPQRRSSAPVALQTYGHAQYPAAPHPHSYYVTDQKYLPEQKYTPIPHHGY